MASFSNKMLLNKPARFKTVITNSGPMSVLSMRSSKLPESCCFGLTHSRSRITLPPEAPSARNPVRPFVHDVMEVDKRDMPVKFTGSGAEKHKVLTEFVSEVDDDTHPAERFVVAGSIAALLIYFCILRQEHHLDKEMRKPLWERIPGLEERTLIGLIEYHKEKGEPTEKYEQRLKEIRAGLTDAKMAW